MHFNNAGQVFGNVAHILVFFSFHIIILQNHPDFNYRAQIFSETLEMKKRVLIVENEFLITSQILIHKQGSISASISVK